MNRTITWFIAFFGVAVGVAGLLYLVGGIAPHLGIWTGILVAIPAATFLVSLSWAFSAETTVGQLARIGVVVILTLVAVVAYYCLFIFTTTNV